MSKYMIFDAAGVLAARMIDGVHTIPSGAVAVPDELWERSIQELDGVWKIGANGDITKDTTPAPVDLMAVERAWRDRELERVVWLRERHRDEQDLERPTTLTAVQFVELLTYMQALRDWPQSEIFPDQLQRPVEPQWLSGI